MATVELRSISKSWGDVVAVDNINLSIGDGEFVAILGPSGCGKSTTLFMLAGVYRPTAGDILFDGERVNDVEARHRNIGIVFQSYALYPNMTVIENILFPTRFQKLPRARERAIEMAELVQIGNLLERLPAQLSGGQQQRVALARALIKEPNTLLLDEPLSNLDATLRLSMRAEIRRITRQLKVTTILVTHDQIEATTMADRIVCMKDGRIEQVGAADALYRQPETSFVAGFIGSPPINLMQVREPLAVNHAAGVTVGIRPEMLFPAERGLASTVSLIEPLGRETLITADTPLGSLRFLESSPISTWKVGDAIRLNFGSSDAIVFNEAGERLPDVQAEVLEISHA